MYEKIKHVFADVARETGVTETEIRGRGRQKWSVVARQECMRRLRDDYKLSYSEIAMFCKRFTAGAVIHGIRRARARLKDGTYLVRDDGI